MTSAVHPAPPKTDRHASHGPRAGKAGKDHGDFHRLIDAADRRVENQKIQDGSTADASSVRQSAPDRQTVPTTETVSDARPTTDRHSGDETASPDGASALEMLASLLCKGERLVGDSAPIERPTSPREAPEDAANDAAPAATDTMQSDATQPRPERQGDRGFERAPHADEARVPDANPRSTNTIHDTPPPAVLSPPKRDVSHSASVRMQHRQDAAASDASQLPHRESASLREELRQAGRNRTEPVATKLDREAAPALSATAGIRERPAAGTIAVAGHESAAPVSTKRLTANAATPPVANAASEPSHADHAAASQTTIPGRRPVIDSDTRSETTEKPVQEAPPASLPMQRAHERPATGIPVTASYQFTAPVSTPRPAASAAATSGAKEAGDARPTDDATDHQTVVRDGEPMPVGDVRTEAVATKTIRDVSLARPIMPRVQKEQVAGMTATASRQITAPAGTHPITVGPAVTDAAGEPSAASQALDRQTAVRDGKLASVGDVRTETDTTEPVREAQSAQPMMPSVQKEPATETTVTASRQFIAPVSTDRLISSDVITPIANDANETPHADRADDRRTAIAPGQSWQAGAIRAEHFATGPDLEAQPASRAMPGAWKDPPAATIALASRQFTGPASVDRLTVGSAETPVAEKLEEPSARSRSEALQTSTEPKSTNALPLHNHGAAIPAAKIESAKTPQAALSPPATVIRVEQGQAGIQDLQPSSAGDITPSSGSSPVSKVAPVETDLPVRDADEELRMAAPAADPPSDKIVTATMPLAQSSTGAALATSIARDLTQSSSIAQPQIRLAKPGPAHQSAHVLKIELHPAELGVVTANLKFVGEQLSIEIQVENHEAYRHLANDSDELTNALRKLGYDVDRVTILQPQTVASPTARTDAQTSSPSTSSRDQSAAFSSSGQGGNSSGSDGQRSGRNPSHDVYASQDTTPARRDGGRGGIVI